MPSDSPPPSDPQCPSAAPSSWQIAIKALEEAWSQAYSRCHLYIEAQARALHWARTDPPRIELELDDEASGHRQLSSCDLLTIQRCLPALSLLRDSLETETAEERAALDRLQTTLDTLDSLLPDSPLPATNPPPKIHETQPSSPPDPGPVRTPTDTDTAIAAADKFVESLDLRFIDPTDPTDLRFIDPTDPNWPKEYLHATHPDDVARLIVQSDGSWATRHLTPLPATGSDIRSALCAQKDFGKDPVYKVRRPDTPYPDFTLTGADGDAILALFPPYPEPIVAPLNPPKSTQSTTSPHLSQEFVADQNPPKSTQSTTSPHLSQEFVADQNPVDVLHANPAGVDSESFDRARKECEATSDPRYIFELGTDVRLIVSHPTRRPDLASIIHVTDDGSWAIAHDLLIQPSKAYDQIDTHHAPAHRLNRSNLFRLHDGTNFRLKEKDAKWIKSLAPYPSFEWHSFYDAMRIRTLFVKRNAGPFPEWLVVHSDTHQIVCRGTADGEALVDCLKGEWLYRSSKKEQTVFKCTAEDRRKIEKILGLSEK